MTKSSIQPGYYEYQETCRSRAQALVQRTENQVIRELAKPEIPSLSPKLAERYRAQGSGHDRRGVNPETLPDQGRDLKNSEMEQKNQTEHPRPAAQQWLSHRQSPDDGPSRITPSPVSTTAQDQFCNSGGTTRLFSSRKDCASIPGHAKRYAADRQGACGTSFEPSTKSTTSAPDRLKLPKSTSIPRAARHCRWPIHLAVEPLQEAIRSHSQSRSAWPIHTSRSAPTGFGEQLIRL